MPNVLITMSKRSNAMTNEAERERIAEEYCNLSTKYGKCKNEEECIYIKETCIWCDQVADFILSEKAKSKQEGRVEAAREIKEQLNNKCVREYIRNKCDSIIAEQLLTICPECLNTTKTINGNCAECYQPKKVQL
jgi:hypothetical protein